MAVARELAAVAGDMGDPSKSPFAPQRVGRTTDYDNNNDND